MEALNDYLFRRAGITTAMISYQDIINDPPISDKSWS